jgi:hypothetical protein
MAAIAIPCQCGCGEYLPIGSTRKYKRGHSPAFKAAGKAPTYGGRPIGTPKLAQQTFKLGESAPTLPDDNNDNWWEINEDGSYSLYDAAAIVENDPDPWGPETPTNKQPFEIKITAGVRRDMEGKLAFMMGMTANMWQMVDPTCGTALANQTPSIAKALVPIMCQSQDVVRWFQKASNFSMYVNLLMAVFPLLSTVYAHHLSKTKGHMPNPSVNGQASTIPESAYSVS